MVVAPPREQRGPLGKVNGFQLMKFLGKGTFGAVYQARREADGKIYAIKKVDTRRMTTKERVEAVNEIRVLASVAGEHVITFYEAFVEQDVLYIVTEFAGNGDLLGYLKNKRRAGHLPEATVWSFFIQMALGTKTMHEGNILHRDLKAANVFLSSNTYLKLGDLGVAKVLKHDQALASTQVGTPYYVAPEVWRNKPYNAKCDMWSLGCLLYELCTFRPPFEAESMEGLARKVMKGRYEPIPSFYSQALRTTLAKLLVVEPKQRASVEEILATDEVRSRMGAVADAIAGQDQHTPSDPVDIVKTIAVPRRFNDLTKNLPPSRYDAPKDVSPKGAGLEPAAQAPHVAHQGKGARPPQGRPRGSLPRPSHSAAHRRFSPHGPRRRPWAAVTPSRRATAACVFLSSSLLPLELSPADTPPAPSPRALAAPPGIDPATRNAAESRSPSEAGYPAKQQQQRQLPPGMPSKQQQMQMQQQQMQQQQQQMLLQQQQSKLQYKQLTQQQMYEQQQQQVRSKLPPPPHQRNRVPADDTASVGSSMLAHQHGAGPHGLHYGQPLNPSMRPGLKLPLVPGAQPPPTPSSYSHAQRPRYPQAGMTPQQQQHAAAAALYGQHHQGAGQVPPSREIRMVYHAPNAAAQDSRVSIFARGAYNPITHTQMYTANSKAYGQQSRQQDYSAQRRRVTPGHWY